LRFLIDPWFYLLAIPAVLITGISKGGFAGGAGNLMMPLMALSVPAPVAAGIALPLLCAMDVSGLKAWWGRCDKREMRVLVPGALVGILIGALTFQFVNEAMMRLLMGLIALGFVLLRWFGPKAKPADPARPATWLGLSMGALSGFSSFTAHAGAPPVQIYLLPRGLDKSTFQSTVIMYFTLVNLAKVPPYFLLGQFTKPVMMTALMMLPAAGIGVFLGYRLQKLIPEQAFFKVMHALLFVTGSKLTYDGAMQLLTG